MIALLLASSLFLSPSPSPSATDTKSIDGQLATSGGEFISFKQADYGPSWGHYRNLLPGMAKYCGLESNMCEVYCPKEGFGKICRVVYSCGPHITKSTESRSGEMLIMDCRVPKPN